MKTLKAIIGFVFGCITIINLAIGMLLAALLGIVPGLLWLLGDWLSDKETSKWIEGPFEVVKDHLRDSL